MDIEFGLILLFSTFFIFSLFYIVRRDIFYGGVYLFLYIYIIFVLIGYKYLPELSIFIKAYFGPEIFIPLTLFVFASFISFFISFCSFYHTIQKKTYRVSKFIIPYSKIMFFLFVSFQLLYIAYFLSTNFEDLNYQSFATESYQKEKGLSFVIFVMMFKYLPPMILLLYVLYRTRVLNEVKRKSDIINIRLILLLLFIFVPIFIFTANKIGNRTDILSLLIGFTVFEYKYHKIILRKKVPYLKFFIIIGTMMVFMNYLKKTRTEEEAFSDLWYEKLLLQDYYAPAHMLIAAINYEYVNPVEVITSNISNSLVKLKYPFLQEKITELFNPGITTRSASYAFYTFTEGYLVLGFMGFLYNGVIFFFLLSFWRRLAQSNNIVYNLFILALISERMATCVRGQTSVFIKDFYMFFLPFIILYGLQTNYFPTFKKIKT